MIVHVGSWTHFHQLLRSAGDSPQSHSQPGPRIPLGRFHLMDQAMKAVVHLSLKSMDSELMSLEENQETASIPVSRKQLLQMVSI
tara:strand:- start:63 stop:317 length:255 start_codon:yes stop_codon:yes gene_type:complete